MKRDKQIILHSFPLVFLDCLFCAESPIVVCFSSNEYYKSIALSLYLAYPVGSTDYRL